MHGNEKLDADANENADDGGLHTKKQYIQGA